MELVFFLRQFAIQLPTYSPKCMLGMCKNLFLERTTCEVSKRRPSPAEPPTKLSEKPSISVLPSTLECGAIHLSTSTGKDRVIIAFLSSFSSSAHTPLTTELVSRSMYFFPLSLFVLHCGSLPPPPPLSPPSPLGWCKLSRELERVGWVCVVARLTEVLMESRLPECTWTRDLSVKQVGTIVVNSSMGSNCLLSTPTISNLTTQRSRKTCCYKHTNLWMAKSVIDKTDLTECL